MRPPRQPQLTPSVKLLGGQDRLRQLTLYVAQECVAAARFGLVKLNKILWKADFDSYAARRIPVTGRAYQKLAQGPAPKEMPRVLNDLLRDDRIKLELTDFGDGIIEKKPIAFGKPNMTFFTDADIAFVDAAIEYYWEFTGQETSDDSHGIAWASREIGQPMFYELAYLSDREIGPDQAQRFVNKSQSSGWRSQ